MTTNNSKTIDIQSARQRRFDDQRKAVVELRERLAEKTFWHILENLASNGYGPNNEAAKHLSNREPRINEVMSALNAAVSCAAGTYRMRDALAIVGSAFGSFPSSRRATRVALLSVWVPSCSMPSGTLSPSSPRPTYR